MRSRDGIPRWTIRMLRKRRSDGMDRITNGEGEPRDSSAAKAFSALSAVQGPPVDEAFKREKREMVLDSMAEALRAKPRAARSDAIILKPRLTRSSVVKRAVLVPAIIVALLVVFTGSAFALSAGANPDSSLYGTKLFFEGVRESLTGSPEAKAQLEMDYAQRRVREMQYLATHNTARGAEGCASAYTDNLAAAQERINQLTGDAFNQASAEFLEVTGSQLNDLNSLAVETSGALSPAVERARQTCNGARQGMMGEQQMRMGPGGGGQNQGGGPGGSGGQDGSGGGGMMQGGGGEQGGSMMQDGGGSGGSMMQDGGGSGGSMMNQDGGNMQGTAGMNGPAGMP